MPGRSLHPATSTEVGKDALTVVYIVRLDIEDDPILVWTGLGDLSFPPGSTGDGALDGQTFSGITHMVGEVGAAADGKGGSAALELALPGVDLYDEAMRQVVFNRRRWQYRQAWVWMAFLDDDNVVVGRPVRLKTGRMDRMPVEEEGSGGQGTVKCRIESAQAYAGEALATRYSETTDLDPTDTSQRYVWQLANMTPALGQSNVMAGLAPAFGNGSGGGGRGGGRYLDLEPVF